MKITDNMIEDGIIKAIYHYRSKYKETHNEYWNDMAKMLEIALSEVTRYHMLRKNWFPGFIRRDEEMSKVSEMETAYGEYLND